MRADMVARRDSEVQGGDGSVAGRCGKGARGAMAAAVASIALAALGAVVVARTAGGGAAAHPPGHVGCKHGHGSTWLASHSRRKAGDDDEDEAPRRSRLTPFTAVGR
jgi:hypothetical protein